MADRAVFPISILLFALAACASRPLASECEFDVQCPPGMYCNARGRCERNTEETMRDAAVDLASPPTDADDDALISRPDADQPLDAAVDCAFFTNEGCGENTTCSFTSDTSTELFCRLNGSRRVGERCSADDSCGSNLYCYRGRCQRMCHPSTNPCDTGLCLPSVGGLRGTVLSLCFGCRLLSDVGCEGESTCTGEGASCRDIAPSAIPGDPCIALEDCGKGQTCHLNTCYKLCRVDAHCTAGETCNSSICTHTPTTSADAGIDASTDGCMRRCPASLACGAMTSDGCSGTCRGTVCDPTSICDTATGECICQPFCSPSASCGSRDGCGGECPGSCSSGNVCTERVTGSGDYECTPSPCPGGCGCGQVCGPSRTCVDLCAPGTTLCGCGTCCGPGTVCTGTECIPLG